MNRFLSYAIVFANIMAILVVTVIQPQAGAYRKKKPQDMRQYLLAQTCTSYQYTDPAAPCYMYMLMTPPPSCNDDASCAAYCGSISSPTANASQGNCPGYLSYQCYSAHTPEYWMWNGSSCSRYEIMPPPPPPNNPFGGSSGSGSSGGSSGGSGDAVYFSGNETQRNIVQEGCLTELKYAEPKHGNAERILSPLGILIEREGTPDTIVEDVKNICLGLAELTAGKMGNDAFQNGVAEKTLKADADYALNNALEPAPGESIQALARRVLHEYLIRIKKEAFDPVRKAKDTDAYLRNPMSYIDKVLPKIKEIIASYQPKEEETALPQAAVPAPALAAIIPVPEPQPAPTVTAAPQRPAPAAARPEEGIVRRIIDVLRRALGLTSTELREQGIRQTRIRASSPEQIWARRDRTRQLRNAFRERYCATHSC